MYSIVVFIGLLLDPTCVLLFSSLTVPLPTFMTPRSASRVPVEKWGLFLVDKRFADRMHKTDGGTQVPRHCDAKRGVGNRGADHHMPIADAATT
jgi:hypothetical protein